MKRKQVTVHEQRENSTKKKVKRERSEAEKLEDDARLLRDLKRRRAEVEEKLNFHKKLVEKSCKGIKDIGKKLAEGMIKPERLEFQKRVYNDFVRLLPTLKEVVAEAEVEFKNCCSWIHDVESSSTATTASTTSKKDDVVDAAVLVPLTAVNNE